MLSNACQYAIRSILYLGMCSDEKHKIGVKIISGELEAPQPFLAKLLQQLNKNGLVTSTKGPYGGFYLSEENKTKTVWDIVLVIDKKFPKEAKNSSLDNLAITLTLLFLS